MSEPKGLIQLINPINKEQEKAKFLFDPLYNPQFLYDQHLTQKDLEKFGVVSNTYIKQATQILKTVMTTYGSESVFLETVEGLVLSREQIAEATQKYLELNAIDQSVRVRFSAQAISQASMKGNVLTFRMPAAQREKRIQGTLNHEIGTHYFRTVNNEHQPWNGHMHEYGFHPHHETEEGLAVLHSHLELKHPYLWFAALYYVLVYEASRLSFSELNQFLKTYVDDKERRWNMCVRVKRGIHDTSVPGAFSKDQVYLRGVMHVLKWLEQHEYDPRQLYIGKIATEDLEKAQAQANTTWKIQLPAFLQTPEQLHMYKEEIKRIRKENGL